MEKLRIVVLMTENVYARELLRQIRESQLEVVGIIIETGSKTAERNRDYLKNDFYLPPSLHEIVADSGIPVLYTKNGNSESCRKALIDLRPDIVLLGGTGILKEPILAVPNVGTLNAHPGLLPKYRGRDIVGWAIHNGDSVGATCHFVDMGVDTGPILLQRTVEYRGDRSLIEVRVRVMRICAELMVEAVMGLESGLLTATPQNPEDGQEFQPLPEDILLAVEAKLSSGQANS